MSTSVTLSWQSIASHLICEQKTNVLFYIVKLTKGSKRRHSYSYAAIDTQHVVLGDAQQGLWGLLGGLMWIGVIGYDDIIITLHLNSN